MRKYFIILLLSIFVIKTYGQIGGLSGSKLNSLCVDPVDKNQMEFEPGFYYLTSKNFWNDRSMITRSFGTADSLMTESALRFRFTYGVSSRMEIGVTVPGDMSIGSWGIKYEVFNNQKSAFALMGGINTPFGNSARNRKMDESALQAGIGAVYTWAPTEAFSADLSIQGMKFFPKPTLSATNYLSFSADAGYYFFDGKLQLASGLGFQKFYYSNLKQYLFTLYPGITIETAKDFVITIIHSVDLVGRNIEKSHITDLSFTFTLR